MNEYIPKHSIPTGNIISRDIMVDMWHNMVDDVLNKPGFDPNKFSDFTIMMKAFYDHVASPPSALAIVKAYAAFRFKGGKNHVRLDPNYLEEYIPMMNVNMYGTRGPWWDPFNGLGTGPKAANELMPGLRWVTSDVSRRKSTRDAGTRFCGVNGIDHKRNSRVRAYMGKRNICSSIQFSCKASAIPYCYHQSDQVCMLLIPAWWLTRSKVQYRRQWIYDLMNKGLAYEIPCRCFRGGAIGDLCWLIMFKEKKAARDLMIHVDPGQWITHTSKPQEIDRHMEELRRLRGEVGTSQL